MLILPLTLATLTLPLEGRVRDEDPTTQLCRAVIAAAELPNPRARFEQLLPVVAATCDLDAATRAWEWPEAGKRPEVARFEQHAAWFFAALAERKPLAFDLTPAGERTLELRLAFDSDRENSYELQLADARIVTFQRSGRTRNELVGSAAAVLDRGGVEALEQWLTSESERATETAGQTVERLWAGLIASGQSTGSFDERYARLTALVDSTHHFPSIAASTIKSIWNDLDPDQAARFIETFRELSIATYAKRFDDTHELTFTVASDEDWRRGIRKVVGSLQKRDGDQVAFEYWMQRRRGRWDVYNVVANGVSDLSLKKTEYRRVLEEGGLPKLLDELRKQIAKQRE